MKIIIFFVPCLLIVLNSMSMDRCDFAWSMAVYERRFKESASEGGEQYARQHPEATRDEIIGAMKERSGKPYPILGELNYVDIAVETGNCFLARTLLTKGAEPEEALHIAAGQNDCCMLKVLLCFMNVNRPFLGDTALHRAAFHGQVEATRFLLQHGADKTIKNTLGATPLKEVKSCLELFKRVPGRYEAQTQIIALLEATT